ncbi:uncharacterized protein LOC106652777 [Trichogramma pretiosum]|uniref:uncharacterized protein LOC106652777 n=1 Tax=Trichogramma pretiosum TaxID=7493 RepID=UPI000C71B027|nr:uncharacterized protein LOC106652777 [Trichogramma pretiosum]
MKERYDDKNKNTREVNRHSDKRYEKDSSDIWNDVYQLGNSIQDAKKLKKILELPMEEKMTNVLMSLNHIMRKQSTLEVLLLKGKGFGQNSTDDKKLDATKVLELSKTLPLKTIEQWEHFDKMMENIDKGIMFANYIKTLDYGNPTGTLRKIMDKILSNELGKTFQRTARSQGTNQPLPKHIFEDSNTFKLVEAVMKELYPKNPDFGGDLTRWFTSRKKYCDNEESKKNNKRSKNKELTGPSSKRRRTK